MRFKSLVRLRLTRLKRRVAHEVRSLRRVFAGRPFSSSPRDSLDEARAARVSTRRELIALAGPIAGAMAGEVVLGLVDTKLVSGLGASALGGVGLGTIVLFLWYSLAFGVMRAVKVRSAFAIGEGRPGDSIRYAHAGLAIGTALGILAFVWARRPQPILEILGAAPPLRAAAADFLRAITWGAPATCALAALIQYRQAIGDARSTMIVGVVGNVINVALGYGLIYGRLGLPAWGVAGSGYATAITECIEFAAMFALLLRDSRAGKDAPASTSIAASSPPAPSAVDDDVERNLRVPGTGDQARLPFGRACREVASLGVPTGLQFGAELLAFTTFTAILGSLGADQIAAHQIALATIRASFLPGIAVSEAASVLVGRALGRRSLAEADRVTYSSLRLAMTFMAGCGVVFALGGRWIALAFSDDEAVIAITTKLLLVAAVFQLLDAANIVLRGALRGAKDVRFVALVAVAIVWLCVPGSALLLGKYANLGALGGWIGFVFETTLASAILFVRYRRGSWRVDYAAPHQRGAREVEMGPEYLATRTE